MAPSSETCSRNTRSWLDTQNNQLRSGCNECGLLGAGALPAARLLGRLHAVQVLAHDLLRNVVLRLPRRRHVILPLIAQHSRHVSQHATQCTQQQVVPPEHKHARASTRYSVTAPRRRSRMRRADAYSSPASKSAMTSSATLRSGCRRQAAAPRQRRCTRMLETWHAACHTRTHLPGVLRAIAPGNQELQRRRVLARAAAALGQDGNRL